jgi:hypothetical protein
VALQVRHVEFRGHFIPVTAMLDVAALDQLVQPLRDNVARAADHTADLGRRCRLAPQLSDQNMCPGEQQLMGVCGFEVGKVGQPDVGQEVDQHIGDDRTLVCERYFGMHHDAPLQFRPAVVTEAP